MFWSLWRCAVADILYKLSGAPIRQLVDADVDRNLKWDQWAKTLTGKLRRLNYCLLKKKEFRSCACATTNSCAGATTDCCLAFRRSNSVVAELAAD